MILIHFPNIAFSVFCWFYIKFANLKKHWFEKPFCKLGMNNRPPTKQYNRATFTCTPVYLFTSSNQQPTIRAWVLFIIIVISHLLFPSLSKLQLLLIFVFISGLKIRKTTQKNSVVTINDKGNDHIHNTAFHLPPHCANKYSSQFSCEFSLHINSCYFPVGCTLSSSSCYTTKQRRKKRKIINMLNEREIAVCKMS